MERKPTAGLWFNLLVAWLAFAEFLSAFSGHHL